MSSFLPRGIMFAIFIGLFTSVAQADTSQTFDAYVQNTQQICGINYSNSKTSGEILTKGEQGTDSSKAIEFTVKSNTRYMTWKITEAHIVENADRFNFNPNLLLDTDRNDTSVYVNNNEYDWGQAQQENQITPNGLLKIAPKINLDATELPLGSTHIQGKIVITCSN